MNRFLRKNLLTINGVPLGAIAGFFYWKFVGCSTGRLKTFGPSTFAVNSSITHPVDYPV